MIPLARVGLLSSGLEILVGSLYARQGVPRSLRLFRKGRVLGSPAPVPGGLTVCISFHSRVDGGLAKRILFINQH